MSKINYVGLNTLTSYDKLIKTYIDAEDAKALKSGKLDGNTLSLFTDENAEGDAAVVFTLPQTSTDDCMKLVSGAAEAGIAIFDADGQVIDSGKSVDDFVQSVTSGTANGTISVDGTDVAVTGLGSAAYTTEDAIVAAAKEDIDSEIGDLEELTTTAKSDVVSAINEVAAAVTESTTDSEITISTEATTDGYAKSYTVAQGGNTIGVIDIPKDMVVESGSVVVNPEGQDEGTYIVLTIANAAEDTLYINVASLVDVYTAEGSAAQVQLTISASNEISATIVAGSVGTTELADSAVTTAKIADGNVTTDKLSTEVQASLTKADSAVQSVAAGSTNGTISVDGTDVAVTGLGSAAYTDADAYDAAGAADSALSTAETYADAAAADALQDAKDYADAAVADVEFEEITEEDIAALFE